MEVEFDTAKEVKIKRNGTQVNYMPFYTSDDHYWMNGCLWKTEQEAIDSVKYDSNIIRLRVMKIELPVLNVKNCVDI